MSRPPSKVPRLRQRFRPAAPAEPAEFAIDGFYFRHEHHFVYWRRLSKGDIGIVTILHERMHQMDRFRDDLRD
jgi:plasmid stabilization system protein ParE